MIRGRLKCSSGLWRCHPDGSGLELLAWGLRNPYGLAFREDGRLYATDNDFEEKGERSIGEDPDRIWHIRMPALRTGRSRLRNWYGFPDICGDGLPAWHENHQPRRGSRPSRSSRTRPPGPARRPTWRSRIAA